MGRRTRVAPSSCPLIIGSLFVCHIFFVAFVSLKGLTSYADTAASQNPRGLFFGLFESHIARQPRHMSIIMRVFFLLDQVATIRALLALTSHS